MRSSPGTESGMLRAIGSVMILGGCFGMGLLYRERMRVRKKTLQQLLDILELFESEVRYGRSVLPECCRRVGEQVGEPFGAALKRAAMCAQAGEDNAFPEVFAKEVGEMLRELPLSEEDKEDFFRFLSPVGYRDEKMQLRAMEQSRERLGRTRDRLEQESAEKSRIALGLGAMGGLLLILILW